MMWWCTILGFSALIGITNAMPRNLASGACQVYFLGQCMPGGCLQGQIDTKMNCTDGGRCCKGDPTPQVVNPRLIDVCGRLMVEARILGGEDYNRCTPPYNSMVSLRFFFPTDIGGNGNLTYCSGSLIDENLVVTTANCIYPFTAQQAGTAGNPYTIENIRVVVGDYDTQLTDYGSDSKPEDRAKIIDVKVHPNYDSSTLDNNIVLLRLDRTIQYNNCKIPACMPPRIENSAYGSIQNDCQMAGFGARFEEDLRPYTRPTKADVRVFDKLSSEEILRYSNATYKPVGAQIVQPLREQQRACAFDWGGIVVCPVDGRWQLTGLISFHSCLQNGRQPILSVDISYYRAWIESCMAGFDQCMF